MASSFWSDYNATLTIDGAASAGMDIYFKSNVSYFVKINGYYIGTSSTYFATTTGETTRIPVTFTPTDNYKSLTVTSVLKNENGSDTNTPTVTFGVKKAATTLSAKISGSSTVNTGETVKVNISGFAYVENNTINKGDFSVSSDTPGISATYYNESYPINETYYTVEIPENIGASAKTVHLTTKFKANVIANTEKSASTQITIHQLATGIDLKLNKNSIYTSETTSASASFDGFATPFNQDITWSLVTSTGSTDSTHASLNTTSGKTVTITPKAAGEVYVKATSGDKAVSKSAKLTINSLGNASITPSTVTLNPNGTATLTAKGFNSEPTWLAKPNIVTISGNSYTVSVSASQSASGISTVTASNTLGQSADATVNVKLITLTIA